MLPDEEGDGLGGWRATFGGYVCFWDGGLTAEWDDE